MRSGGEGHLLGPRLVAQRPAGGPPVDLVGGRVTQARHLGAERPGDVRGEEDVAEAEQGMAVVFATSELGEAITASHRILVMATGRVVA